MFENGTWYQGQITGVEYIKSKKKGTPAIELTVLVPEHGSITGQWWITDALVSDPREKTNKVLQWEAARIRCMLFGCDEEKLNMEGWVDHIRETLINQPAAVCAKVNNYGDVEAQFIGKPKGKSEGSKHVRQEAASSPFANRKRPEKVDPFAITDDDVPF